MPTTKEEDRDDTQPIARDPVTSLERDTERKMPATMPKLLAADAPTEPKLEARPATDIIQAALASTDTLPPPDRTRGADEVREHFQKGDFETTLAIAEAVLVYDPSNAEVRSYAQSAALRLRRIYAAKLGSLAKVPRANGPAPSGLDERGHAILGLVDGTRTIEEIVREAAIEMSEVEALRIVVSLAGRGVIAIG